MRMWLNFVNILVVLFFIMLIVIEIGKKMFIVSFLYLDFNVDFKGGFLGMIRLIINGFRIYFMLNIIE